MLVSSTWTLKLLPVKGEFTPSFLGSIPTLRECLVDCKGFHRFGGGDSSFHALALYYPQLSTRPLVCGCKEGATGGILWGPGGSVGLADFFMRACLGFVRSSFRLGKGLKSRMLLGWFKIDFESS